MSFTDSKLVQPFRVKSSIAPHSIHDLHKVHLSNEDEPDDAVDEEDDVVVEEDAGEESHASSSPWQRLDGRESLRVHRCADSFPPRSGTIHKPYGTVHEND